MDGSIDFGMLTRAVTCKTEILNPFTNEVLHEISHTKVLDAVADVDGCPEGLVNKSTAAFIAAFFAVLLSPTIVAPIAIAYAFNRYYGEEGEVTRDMKDTFVQFSEKALPTPVVPEAEAGKSAMTVHMDNGEKLTFRERQENEGSKVSMQKDNGEPVDIPGNCSLAFIKDSCQKALKERFSENNPGLTPAELDSGFEEARQPLNALRIAREIHKLDEHFKNMSPTDILTKAAGARIKINKMNNPTMVISSSPGMYFLLEFVTGGVKICQKRTGTGEQAPYVYESGTDSTLVGGVDLDGFKTEITQYKAKNSSSMLHGYLEETPA